jgi:lysophospholipase L1-like esterase
MKIRIVLALALALALGSTLFAAASDRVIDPLDELRFRAPKEKARAELVDGKVGRAIRLTYDADARGAFFTSNLRGAPEWDQAEGFSFWVKGDGSDSYGGLEFIYDEDYAVRYDFAFPIKNTEWQKITVAWRDLVPVLPGPRAKLLDPKGENRPSRLSALWFGKWWYWGDYPAHSYTIDDLRLETTLPHVPDPSPPAGAPLQRVLAKLKAGQPVTLVTMGDSLTDFRHWANRKVAWPNLLRDELQKKYRSVVTVVNPAIGGTQLRQNLILMPRWRDAHPAPDLVTVCFGFNDWDAGMRGDAFREAYEDAVDRIRRATRGRSDVLILTTNPAASRWEAMAELGAACRKAAQQKNAGLADTERAFYEAGKTDRERLFVNDRTHLSPDGHGIVAATVLGAIERAGR